jgi:alcohol dehydrogenase (NADP+)
MCQQCNNPNHAAGDAVFSRRNVLLGGATGLAATSLASVAMAGRAQAQDEAIPGLEGPFETRAFGTPSPEAPIAPMTIRRRQVGADDVLIEVLYAGICHTDIHQIRDDWQGFAPTVYPIVPGHEVVGRVMAVGSNVTRFRAGDLCGVGCMVNSCGNCRSCRMGLEQHCEEGFTLTYNSPDTLFEGHTLGGFSKHMVVRDRFVVRIPAGVDLAAYAPILCAGVTTFSPIRRWNIEDGQRIAVVGMGGLGHLALKLAVSRGADVTVFTTTPGKVEDALDLGAREAVVWSDASVLANHANQFDTILSTVPYTFPMDAFLGTLRTGGTLVNIGNLMDIGDLGGAGMIFGRKTIAGTLIGGMPETQEVVDYCAANNIKADIELIQPSQINEALSRVYDKDVRYRFVIDMTAA